MSKKTVEKLEVIEIKTYKCSDGSVYDTKEEALSHEQFLKDCNANPLIASKIKELESKILALEAENATLSAKIQYLESKNTFPWRPYQNPQNPMTPTPKLPAEPGDVIYSSDKQVKHCSDNGVDLSKLSDKELLKRGYSVVNWGDKKRIIQGSLNEPVIVTDKK